MPINESPAARAESQLHIASPASMPVRVWDAPTRVCHGLMVLCFVGAWLTAGQPAWRLPHETLGFSLAGLALFRIVWGFVGSRHARFATFLTGPRELVRYLRQWPLGWSRRYLGHSPAAGWGLVLALALILVAAVTPRAWPAAHLLASQALLGLAVLFLVAACFGSWRSGENRLRTMVTGTCTGSPAEAAGAVPARRRAAWLLPAALLGFWCYQVSALG